MIATFRKALDGGYHTNKTILSELQAAFRDRLEHVQGRCKWNEHDDTRLPLEKLKELARAHHDGARELQAPSARAEDHGRPPGDGARRAAARLGHGRASRLRDAAGRRLFDPALGPGQRPRHVFPSPRGAARPEPRALGPGHLRAASAREREAGRFRRHRLAAVGRSGGRLRVRLRDLEPERARHLGGAVRRFRERRPGRHRPVHRVGRSEVGPHVRPRDDAAARLRRAGARALVRRGSSATSSCARTTTCRSACRRRRCSSTTCCAGRWCGRTASRSSSSRRKACCGTRNRSRRSKSSRTTSSGRSTRTGKRRTSTRRR